MSSRDFVLKGTLRENVIEARRVLGAFNRELSLRGLADLINRQHPTKTIDFKAVERWIREVDPVEPDVASIAIMAHAVGASFEDFALGEWRAGESIEDGELVAVPAPHPRRALSASRATKRRKAR